MLVGKHVKWERVKSKPNPSMHESKGFGVLGYQPVIGQSLSISGDYGVTTSTVISFEEKDNELTVVTRNSTYKITKDISS